MTTTDFSATLLVDKTPSEVLDAIANVSGWWTESFKGNAKSLGDTFSVQFGETFVDFKIVELLPEKKVVWLVTDCNLPWNSDLKEWTDTKIIWEVSASQKATQINFTHIGLAELDCGDQCMNSWDNYIRQSLFKLITEGKGLPNNF